MKKSHKQGRIKMNRLGEPYVQKEAIEYLRIYYSTLYQPEKIFVKDEMKTIKKLKGRADGFICFHSVRQIHHTVSIEAKSHKTIPSLFPFMSLDDLDGDIGILSIVLALASIYFVFHWEWYWILLFVVGMFFLILIVLFLLTGRAEFKNYKIAGVVNQVMRYPANEKWIAVSKDSLNLLQKKKGYVKGDNYTELLNICKRKGIGLIVINRSNHPKILIKPKIIKGEFVKSYKNHKEVELFLSSHATK